MAESTTREKAISKGNGDSMKSKQKTLLRRVILQALTPRVPVAEQELMHKIGAGADVSLQQLRNFAKKYFEAVKSAGIKTGSRVYKNAQYAAAEAGESPEAKPHKARGGAVKKYSHGGSVSSGHQLTYKRK